MQRLTISASAVSHSQISVVAGGRQKTYPTHDAFFRWVAQVQARLPAESELVVRLPAVQYAHPADILLREAMTAGGIHIEDDIRVWAGARKAEGEGND